MALSRLRFPHVCATPAKRWSFFFSSRRRHTRFDCDWSSDVCSSDLYLLDLNPRAYVYLYPAAAILGVIGIWQFSHIRIRHEFLLRRREEQLYTPSPENIAESDETNVLNYVPAPRPHWFVRMFTQAWEVLRRDKDFRDYQRWQFLSGVSFMMFQPALLYMVSRQLTDPKRQYLLATFVVQIIPMIFSFLFAPVWAPFFDRVHITRFRTV